MLLYMIHEMAKPPDHTYIVDIACLVNIEHLTLMTMYGFLNSLCDFRYKRRKFEFNLHLVFPHFLSQTL